MLSIFGFLPLKSIHIFSVGWSCLAKSFALFLIYLHFILCFVYLRAGFSTALLLPFVVVNLPSSFNFPTLALL